MEFIKNTFWSRQANAFHPYILRPVPIVVSLLMLVGVQFIFNMSAAQPQVLGFATDISPTDVLSLTNQERERSGAGELSLDRRLSLAAEAKAEDMLKQDYWSHNAPDGTEPWAFVSRYGYNYLYAGENLAKNFRTSEGVVQGWLNSEGHRENLLSTDYSDIGLAVKNGVINGEKTTLVVALYGQPQTEVASASSQQTTRAPAATQFSALNPLAASATMTWAMKAAVPVMALFTLMYIGQHVVLRRKHLAWDEHVHPRPLLQAGVMAGMLVVMFVSSMGVVG